MSAVCGIEPAGAVELLKRAGERYTKALTNFGDGEEQSAAFKEFMQSMCGQVAVSVESAVRVSANTITDLRTREATLQGAVTDLQQKVLQSDFDPMTKVLNRRGFTERAKRLLDGANRRRAWCAVGFIDLDNFKRLNDNYSHATGDAALILVASRLTEAVNRKGIAGRIGGDEFCFMVVSQVAEFDQQEADRIKAAFSDLQVEANGEMVRFTTSVGLLSLGEPPCLMDFDAAMERADELMYAGKKSGKDRCVVGRIHAGGAHDAPLLAAG
jgi:diguanylate cyclase (GGDEF)-like protein